MEINIINFTKPETGSFLVDIILWLVQLFSSVAVGIVLFTLLLKLITFPFDYMSRASMRKNSVKMEEMRPELEKLQKQYADNKDLYNQKMMALYKKNGYSMFGACLPTILTLVIFIIAINAFTDYSNYQNKQYFYDMSLSYNEVVYEGFETDGEYIIKQSDGSIVIDYNKLINNVSSFDSEKNEETYTVSTDNFNIFITNYKTTVNVGTTEAPNYQTNYSLKIYTENGYVKQIKDYKVVNNSVDFSGSAKNIKYEIIENKLLSFNAESIKDYNLATEKNNYLLLGGKDFSYYNSLSEDEGKLSVKEFLNSIQKEKSAETFIEENQKFLWVKNIWVTDSPMKHPVESNWSTFCGTYKYEGFDIGQNDYDNLTAKLNYEKSAPNGYLILVILTAASSFFMQLVMGKAQKAQMELQTVDGQGAQTQKIMKWMMPIMMAFFAFMYTAAFSIYIVLSSLISMATTFLINFIVDRKLKREKVKAGQVENNAVIRGRVYTPKEEEEKPVEKKKEKKKKKDQFTHDTGEDFLSGKADKKKHVRGRMK